METILQQLEDLLKELIDSTLTSSTGSFMISAKIIAGVGFLIFAYFEGYHQLLGEKWDWKKLGAPLAIILGIAFYGTFLDITNSLLDTITGSIKEELKISEESFYKKLDDYSDTRSTEVYDKEYEESIAKIVTIKQARNSPDDDEGFITSVFSGTGRYIENAITGLIFKMFKLFAQLAFSIYPPLKGSFSTWLQKYINVYLWLPVSYIMQAILLKIYTLSETSNSSLNDGAFSDVVHLLLLSCSIIGFAMVPIISGWFLSASTVTGASKLKGKGQQAMKTIIKKSATGGV